MVRAGKDTKSIKARKDTAIKARKDTRMLGLDLGADESDDGEEFAPAGKKS